jgi:hypothetical protein
MDLLNEIDNCVLSLYDIDTDALNVLFGSLTLSCTREELQDAASTLKRLMVPQYATEYKTMIDELLESNEHGVDVFVAFSKMQWCQLDDYLKLVVFTVPWCLLFFVQDEDAHDFVDEFMVETSEEEWPHVLSKVMSFFKNTRPVSR